MYRKNCRKEMFFKLNVLILILALKCSDSFGQQPDKVDGPSTLLNYREEDNLTSPVEVTDQSAVLEENIDLANATTATAESITVDLWSTTEKPPVKNGSSSQAFYSFNQFLGTVSAFYLVLIILMYLFSRWEVIVEILSMNFSRFKLNQDDTFHTNPSQDDAANVTSMSTTNSHPSRTQPQPQPKQRLAGTPRNRFWTGGVKMNQPNPIG